MYTYTTKKEGHFVFCLVEKIIITSEYQRHKPELDSPEEHSCQVCTVSLAHYGIEGASSFGMQCLRSPENKDGWMEQGERGGGGIQNKDKYRIGKKGNGY